MIIENGYYYSRQFRTISNRGGYGDDRGDEKMEKDTGHDFSRILRRIERYYLD